MPPLLEREERGMKRERTYSWSDPSELIEAMGREPNHLTWMQAMIEGRLPVPAFGATLELRAVEVSEQSVAFTMPLREWMLNPAGVVHGGVLATLLDSAMTFAVIARLDRAFIGTTTTLTTHFVRPLFADNSEVRAEARVLHRGRTLATAEGSLTDATGRIAAHGTGGFAIIPAPFATR